MTLKYGPNLAQLIGAAPGEEHYQAILSQWRALDGLVQPAVSSRVASLPTTDMLEGDRYLLTSGTYANRIARYREANTEAGLAAAWEYFTPKEGWFVWSAADKKGYRYTNGAWVDATYQGGTLSTSLNEAPIVTLASAATLAIGAASANTIQVTGTTTITAFDTITAGARRTLRFSDALILTHSATSLILPRGADIVTVAGDVADLISLGGGNWVCVGYQRVTVAGAKADMALGNVDNTSDANKPISTATQTALDLKANKSGPTFTDRAYSVGDSGVFTALAKPSGTQTGLTLTVPGAATDRRSAEWLMLNDSDPRILFRTINDEYSAAHEFLAAYRASSGHQIDRLAILGTNLVVGQAGQINSSYRLQALGGVYASGPIRPGQYTMSTLPSAAAFAGAEIDVTDATGGPKRCRSNGSNWQVLNTTNNVS